MAYFFACRHFFFSFPLFLLDFHTSTTCLNQMMIPGMHQHNIVITTLIYKALHWKQIPLYPLQTPNPQHQEHNKATLCLCFWDYRLPYLQQHLNSMYMCIVPNIYMTHYVHLVRLYQQPCQKLVANWKRWVFLLGLLAGTRNFRVIDRYWRVVQSL